MGAAHLILLFLYHSYILLPYIHIDVYTTIHIYMHGEQYICLTYLRCLFYIHFYLSFHFRF